MVLDEAVRQGRVLSLKDFLSVEQSIYQKRWVPGLGTIFTWILRQAGLPTTSLDKDGGLKSGQLVMTPNLEAICQRLEEYRARKSDAITDRVLTRDAFAHILKDDVGTSLSKQEQDVLLKYLQRDKSILAYDSNTIKFKSISASTPEPVTQEDASIATLAALMSSINMQISILNSKIEQLQTEAKAAVENKSKARAIAALRSKRLAEQTLKSRSDTLYKLEEVYTSIQQAADQVALVKVMQSSAQTLKSLNKQVGGAERVDTIMDDLREQMDETADVQRILQEPLTSDNIAIDEAEIDAEFEAMSREEAAGNTISEEEEKRNDAMLVERKIEDHKRMLETKHRESNSTREDASPEDELSSSIRKLNALQLDKEERQQTETQISGKDRDKDLEGVAG